MKTTRIVLAAFALVAVAGLTGCNNNKTDASGGKMEAKATNKTCPFSGRAASDKYVAQHDDQAVAFCCPNCKAKFEKMDDAKQHEVMAKAK